MSNQENKEFLSDEKVDELIKLAKEGDNDAWMSLYNNYERYVWFRVEELSKGVANDKNSKDDLFEDGWCGFVDALRNYDPQKGKLSTFAKKYIDGEIIKGIKRETNPLGIKGLPKEGGKLKRVSYEDAHELHPALAAEIESAIEKSKEPVSRLTKADLDLKEPEDKSLYSGEAKNTLQIMEVLRLLTDEKHSLTKAELAEQLHTYRAGKYLLDTPIIPDNTITSLMDKILSEVNPDRYIEEDVENEIKSNDGDYRIKYSGYKEDALWKKTHKEKGEKAPAITEFRYTHKLDYDALDRLIQIITFSDFLSYEMKNDLIDRLVSLGSVYYESEFWDGEKLKFNPNGIHGRFTKRNMQGGPDVMKNIRVIQEAMNKAAQVRFKFNRYTEDYGMVHKTEWWHTLSPYHLVVYQDRYYCIGLRGENDTGNPLIKTYGYDTSVTMKEHLEKERIWHYRVDLMSDVEIRLDENGNRVPMRVFSFQGLPIQNINWNPEKYMAEHMNMAFDKPRPIRLKIKNTDYTMLHDWFGDHYRKTVIDCEDGYDIVEVTCSPFMMVHWAMQYGDAVEVMDEELRKQIREEAERMVERYGK